RARRDQQRQRQESAASLCDRAGRHLQQRKPGSDASRRGWLHVHGRQLGHRLEDRRAFRHCRALRVKMDPKLERQDRNRGVALWQNLVVSVTGYAGRVIATDKETGTIVWDKNLLDQADLELTAAPLALKDSILIGGSGGDRGLRNWVAALDPK